MAGIKYVESRDGAVAELAGKASPVGADVLMIEDSAANNAKKKVSIANLPGGAAPPPAATLAAATGDITTASGTDVVATSMTQTPAAGTYLVAFSGSLDHDSNSSSIETSVWSAGSQVASSERRFVRGAGQGNVTGSFICQAKVTVNGSQAIEGRWRTSGATATMHERVLSILEVA